LSDLVSAAIIISIVVIAARFIWMYPATYLPRWLSPSLRRKDPSPPWQWPFALAFTGVRGIVSLAAALAIPFSTAGGQPFPGRDLILFLTFSVILVTLVGQGLLLPTVIRALGLAHAGHRERLDDRIEELQARQHAIEAVIARLEQLEAERKLADDIVAPLRLHHRERLRQLNNQAGSDGTRQKLTRLQDEIELSLIEIERQQINELFRSGKLKDEARRRIERQLDLREAERRNRDPAEQ
jgi:CPA1 family monovalent cation:H+ antiporter